MRIIIILIFGIFSYLLVFLPGFFLFLPEGEEYISGEKTFLSDIEKKTDKLSFKNPGKEPPPK